jgi:hypothetical protein
MRAVAAPGVFLGLLTKEPTKFEEANTKECWCRAMDEELGSIHDNNT